MNKKVKLTEKMAKNTNSGGVVVGKRRGQTMIFDDATAGGYFVGKLHSEGGIKAINKSTGQPIEVQSAEVIITAPAVADQTKREFDGKMMTNREILSTINERGGGVAFAEAGMEIPTEMHFSGSSYNYGGKMLSDHDIAYELSKCGCEHEMKKGGHLAKGMSLKQIAKMHDVTLRHINRQVSYGMKAESEHTSSKAMQLRIVKDHLYENPNYYTILKTAGLMKGGGVKTTKVVTYKDKYNKKYNYPKNTSHTLEEISKDTNVSLKGLQQIYNKGIGAYKTNPSSVRPNVKSKEQWAMARVYSAVMGGKASKVDSNELKMNVGGGIRKENLVKDAKNGNTPARDLNNYNDVLDVGADGEVGDANGLAFAKGGQIENVEVLNWDKVPNDYRNISKVKEVRFENDPMNEGLYNIVSPFLAKSDLRPALMGVNFDENGITATDANILVTLPYPNRDFNGVYDINWAKKNKAPKALLVDAKYPNYSAIIPYYNMVSPYPISVYKLLQYTKTALNYADKNISGISYKFGDNDAIGFNGKFLVKILTTALKLGHEKIYAFLSSPNRVMILSPKENYVFGRDEILATMPIMLQSQFVNLYSFGTENKIFNTSFKVYYDFNDDEIHNADGSVADFQLQYGSQKASTISKKPTQAKDDFSFLDDVDNVFYEGGTVGNDKVNSVKIISTSYSYNGLSDKTFNSYKEFKIALRQEFNNQNKAFGRLYLEVNNGKAQRFEIQIKDGKNTVLNFNPNTGNADDFEKQLLRRAEYRYKKYDWNDWYSGNVSTSSVTASAPQQQTNSIFTPSEILEIDQLPDTNYGVKNEEIINLPSVIRKLVRLREFELKGTTVADNLYAVFDWLETAEGFDFWSKIRKGDFRDFKNRYGSVAVPPKELLISDLTNKKIWIGNDLNLKNKVLQVLKENNIPIDDRLSDNNKAYNLFITFWKKDFVIQSISKSDFDNFPQQEIFPADLGIAVNNLGGASTTQPNASRQMPTKTLTRADLIGIKVRVNNDRDLALKVVDKLKSFGFTDNEAILRRINNSSDEIYAITTSTDPNSIYVGWMETEKTFIEFDFFKELSLSDLFMNTSTISIDNQMPTDLSQIPRSRAKVLFEIKKFVDDNKLTPNPAVVENLPNIKTFRDEETGQVFNFTFDNTLLNPSSKIASNLLFEFLDFEKGFNDFTNKKIKDLSDGMADLNLLAISEVRTFEKEQKEIDALIKLLPAFQESKFAPQKATIIKEIGRLHKKITYEGFIFQNERYSEANQLFTPQGLLKYYYNQTTQSPVAPLEPACELPTPNGAKSKLPLSAYFNVRTTRFKKWFGDWEKAYETNNYVDCSKMIDEETKEPKIFYHGVRKYVPNFGQFSNMGQGVVRPYGSFEPPTAFPASYFSDSEDYAKFYGGEAPNMPKPTADYEPFIYKVFLSAKNPISLLPLGFESSYKDMIDYLLVAYGVRVQPSRNVLSRIQNDMKAKHPLWVYVRNDVGLLETLKDYGYDSLIQTGDIPTFDDSGNVINDRTKFIQDEEYLTFYPTQVKSATVKKSFYFDFFKDIRFKQGGYVRI